MDLAEFVKKTLVQVVYGVSRAQAELRTLGMSANTDDALVIKFDVAVSVGDEQTAEVGNTVKVVSVKDGESVTSAHRITFQVPFTLSVEDPVKKKIQEQQAKNQAAIDERIEHFTSPFS